MRRKAVEDGGLGVQSGDVAVHVACVEQVYGGGNGAGVIGHDRLLLVFRERQVLPVGVAGRAVLRARGMAPRTLTGAASAEFQRS